jgi:PAS domain S-box-containing protein
MTIKFKLLLIGIMSSLSIVLVGGFIIYSNKQSIKAKYRESVAYELVLAVFERNLFLSDYLLHPTDRAREQLLARHKDIEVLLLTVFDAFSGNTKDEIALKKIEDNHDRINLDLNSLLAERDAGIFATDSVTLNIENQRVNQILLKSQSTVDLSNKLSSQSNIQAMKIRQRALTSIIVFVIIGFLLSITAIVIIRSIILSLKDIQIGAIDIASGNLNTKIKVKKKNELGQLAVAFNTMTSKLKESYGSLEAKILERTYNLQQQVKETRRFQQAVDEATDGVIMTSPDQNIIYYNKACEILSGYTQKEVLNKDINKFLVSPKTPKELLAKIKRTINAGDTFITEDIMIRTKDGKDIEVELSIFPIQEDGQIQFFVGLLQDISKRKEIDRVKTEFVSLASHQLRTPLSSINWYTEMLLAEDVGKVNDKQKKYLNEIYYGNQRMIELVNALLNVSRLELGTFVVEPEPTNIVALIRSVMDEQKLAIDNKKITFKLHFAEDLPIIEADTKLLRMVFQNLLSNSIKYTPELGLIELSLYMVKKGQSVDAHRANEDSIAFKISDTGYGIPKGQQDKIFTKLFRADNVREYDTEGTGLGLYIVKSIINHSGGKIWFESPSFAKVPEGNMEENLGTTFYVTIPLSGMKKKEGIKALA